MTPDGPDKTRLGAAQHAWLIDGLRHSDATSQCTPNATSRGTAVAAAAFRRATGEMGKLIEDGTAFWNVMPTALRGEVLPTNGGVPVVRGGKVIGGIGCGGGTGEQDHECAAAGAQAIVG